MTIWFETDVGPHLLDCLNNCENQISLVKHDERVWPWVFVSLTSLLQATCVLYLDERDTMGVDALSKTSRLEKIKCLQHDYDGPMPSFTKLATPKELLRRVRQDSGLAILEQKNHRLLKVIALRNEFMHFSPKGFSLEMSGAIDLASRCIQAIIAILDQKGMYGDFRIPAADRQLAIVRCSSLLSDIENQTTEI